MLWSHHIGSGKYMNVVKCTNGHFFDKDKNKSCPICIKSDAIDSKSLEDLENNSSGSHSAQIREIDYSKYIWDQAKMSSDDIIGFSISFGDRPIITMTLSDGHLLISNSINGSRDGWMNFPDNYFRKKNVKLTENQQNDVYSFLKEIDFTKWQTDNLHIRNYEERAEGFCANERFSCEFKNGLQFKCLFPKEKSFNDLRDLLESFVDKEFFHFPLPLDFLEPEVLENNDQYSLKLQKLPSKEILTFVLEEITVGKSKLCNFVLQNNCISRNHATFSCKNGKWFLCDNNSMNGTEINKKRLTPGKEYRLRHNDIISFATIEKFTFLTPEPKKESKIVNYLYGAIIGDIVGSVYEFNNIKNTDFELFSDKCFFTDDMVMTVAVADALIESFNSKAIFQERLVNKMQEYGQAYPERGYGSKFASWLQNKNPKPYYSFGNGSAMRASACGIFALEIWEALSLAKASAEVTHNHPEGIKGAQAVAGAVFLAKTGRTKEEIKGDLKNSAGEKH